MKVGQHTQALEAAGRFRESYPDSEFLPDTLEVLGQAALNAEQLDVASTTFRDLVSRFPEHSRHDWWETRVGWTSYLQGNYDDAIGWLSQSVLNMQDPVCVSEARYVIGSSQYEMKNFVKAIESLEASLDANPARSNAGEVRLLLARAWFNRDDKDRALEIAKSVWEDSREPAAAFWLGEFSYDVGEFAAAAGYYQQMLEADPDSRLAPDALYGLAWARNSNAEPELAAQAFDQLISRFPDHSLIRQARIGRGKARRLAGKFEEAIEDLNRFLESDPPAADRFNGLFERALCYVQVKDWKSAIADLQPLAAEPDLDPEMADDLLFELAWALQEDGQAAEALAHFRKIADEYPNSPHAAEAHYHVGQSLYGEERFGEAILRYQQALDGKPDDRVGELANYKLAWCHFRNDDFADALQAFQRQVTRYPEGELHAVGLSMVAESHFQLDQHAEAITAYKVAIPAIASSGVTSNVRVLAPIHAAQSANQIKQHDVALEYARQVIEKHAESPFLADAWYEAGVAERALGNRDKAVAAWEEAMKNSLGKTGARARCMIGEVYFAEKDYEQAINQFKLVLNGYGGRQSSADVRPWQAFAAYEAARCYYVQIRAAEDEPRRQYLIDRARQMFQRLVDDYPEDQLVDDARKQLSVLDGLK
jgi:TolA-binding protein